MVPALKELTILLRAQNTSQPENTIYNKADVTFFFLERPLIL